MGTGSWLVGVHIPTESYAQCATPATFLALVIVCLKVVCHYDAFVVSFLVDALLLLALGHSMMVPNDQKPPAREAKAATGRLLRLRCRSWQQLNTVVQLF